MNEIWTATNEIKCKNEAEVELRVVLPLLTALGYSTEDIAPKFAVKFQAGRRGRNPEADFVVFYGASRDKDHSLIVVEAKSPGESFEDANSQAESYAQNLRSPFYIATDGEFLQVWQLQISATSKKVLDLHILQLGEFRGRLEALLSREDAFQYCRSLDSKSAMSVAINLVPYFSSEYQRIGINNSVSRTLMTGGAYAGTSYQSTELLELYPAGAIVTGASGQGKSTLANVLFSKCLEKAIAESSQRIVCQLFFPVQAASSAGIFEYVADRVRAKCPQLSLASIKDLIRKNGAVILADGFERLSESQREIAAIGIANLSRDYALLQIFVFSRVGAVPSTMHLPMLQMMDLNEDQQAQLLSAEGLDVNAQAIMTKKMPAPMAKLKGKPLLLSLMARYWIKQQESALHLEQLFQKWRDELLGSLNLPPSAMLRAEEALTEVATFTVNGPASANAVLMMLQTLGYSDAIFDGLLQSGSIVASGDVVELAHESLADFLRAKRLVANPDKFLHFVHGYDFNGDSLLPIFLLRQQNDRKFRNILSNRLAGLDLSTYLETVKFSLDRKHDFFSLSKGDAEKLLSQDIELGINDPLVGILNSVASSVKKLFGGEEMISIHGALCNKRNNFDYNISSKDDLRRGEEISLDSIRGASQFFRENLEGSGVEIDHGRRIGARILNAALKDIIEARWLNGGQTWIHERLLSRVRYLGIKGLINLTNKISLAALSDNIARIPPDILFALVGQLFSVADLIDDIDFLVSCQLTELDNWPVRLITPGDDEATLAAQLREHTSRAQLAYREVCEKTFPKLAKSFGMYNVIPVQWSYEINFKSRITEYYWRPVEKWDDIEADVKFSDSLSRYDFFEANKHQQNMLDKLGRRTVGSVRIGGIGILPDLDGKVDGESSVVREVCDTLEDDLAGIFAILSR